MRIPLILAAFFTFVVGAMIAILATSYRSIEQRRARDLRRRTQPHAAVEAIMLARIEDYLRSEQDIAAQFVSAPSVDALYRFKPHDAAIN